MPRLILRFLAALVLTTASGADQPPASSSPTHSPTPLSQRVVHYEIEAKLDAGKYALDATEILTYRNLTGKPQDTFPFHLYLNAFQPKSTFVREAHRDYPDREFEKEYLASIEIRSLTVDGMGDLTSQMKFIAPDDGNADDRTVMQVKLPRPVAPGADITFRIAFHDQFGEVLARTGYSGKFLMGAQWFPKVGVWWKDAWNCHQFHEMTEFFADFGVFDVKLTVPQNEIVGATGVQTATMPNPDGTKTLTFRAEDVHDFAWAVQPDFRVFTETFSGSAGPVTMRLLMQPSHAYQAQRHMQALRETMRRFNDWYGPYPYRQITLIDPPVNGIEAGGMEYPTLMTGGTAWGMPRGLRLVESVVEHEFGHQYWYGMVATNEFEEAWLDEGINQYVEAKVLDDVYGPERSMLDLWGMTAGEFGEAHRTYMVAPDRDPIARFAFRYLSENSYGTATYFKTALALKTVEGMIGEDTLRRALRTYFERYRFQHPTGEDFLKTLEEASGQNLRPFFEQAIFGTQVLDYEVLKAGSDRVDWYLENPPKEKKGETVYRTQVVVHRKGDFIFPVDVLMRFDNGESITEHWDGRDRWIRYEYDKKAKLISAVVDPEQKVVLDTDLFNNGRSVRARTEAASKISGYWTLLQQFFGQLLAWFA